MVMGSGGKTMGQLAAEAGVVRSYFTRILRLSFLAPEIVTAHTGRAVPRQEIGSARNSVASRA